MPLYISAEVNMGYALWRQKLRAIASIATCEQSNCSCSAYQRSSLIIGALLSVKQLDCVVLCLGPRVNLWVKRCCSSCLLRAELLHTSDWLCTLWICISIYIWIQSRPPCHWIIGLDARHSTEKSTICYICLAVISFYFWHDVLAFCHSLLGLNGFCLRVVRCHCEFLSNENNQNIFEGFDDR